MPVGKLQVADSEELHFLPWWWVAVKPNGYNEVKGYKPVQQAQPAPTPAQWAGDHPGASQRLRQPAAATAPWKRSA